MNYAQRKDRELIRAYLAGDHEAWDALVERYQQLVYNIPIHLRFTPEQANGIFQSVCLSLLRELSQRIPKNLKAWLVFTTVKECRRQLRAASSEPLSDYIELSDAELQAVYLAGDETAWDVLVERYKRLVVSIPRNFGFTPFEADDVFQSVWLSLLQYLPLNDPNKVKAWLVTTAKRECQSRRRGASYEREDMVDPQMLPEQRWVEWLTPEEIVIRYERHEALRKAMERLSERCYRLLYSLFIDPSSPSYDKIAQQLKMAKGSIGATRRRCLEKLKLEMGR